MMLRLRRLFQQMLVAVILSAGAGAVAAQDNPLAPGWTLQPDGSSLQFLSVKNEGVIESSAFATMAGTISPDGNAEVRILLDSVDTKIDLRNVRMRFLFFETFKFPEALIRLSLDPVILAQLATERRVTVSLPYTLELHGVSRDSAAQVTMTLISDDLVSVASIHPIVIAAADFGLGEGVTKLEEAAGVSIVPSGSITFDFAFARNGGASDAAPVIVAPENAALETEGNFDREACIGRFEILSAAGNISFRSGSATLNEASNDLLDTLVGVIERCPDMRIEVAGHTDSDGSEQSNLVLSERRAVQVVRYLVDAGIAPDRLVARGYGETQPFVPNTSPENKRRNRRIAFVVMGN